MVSGKDSDNSLVRFKTKKLEISSETPVAWTRDGENGGEHTHVVLENLHQAFEILVKNSPEVPYVGELPEGAAETAVTVEPLLIPDEADTISDDPDRIAEDAEASEDSSFYKELTGNILSLGSGKPVSVEQIIQALEKAFSDIAAEFTSKLQKD